MTQLLATLADRYAIDTSPGTTTTFTSRGSNKLPAGETVTLATIAGHRDVSMTECPGDAAYAVVAGDLQSRVSGVRTTSPTPVAPATTVAAPASTSSTTPAASSTTGAGSSTTVDSTETAAAQTPDDGGTPWAAWAVAGVAAAGVAGVGATELQRRKRAGAADEESSP